MTEAQKGICAVPNIHALFLIFTAIDDAPKAMRVKLVHLLDLFTYFD